MEDFTILPVGTLVLAPFDKHVTLIFPTEEDSIVFHEFLRAFISGEIELEAREGTD